jgi:hypothetical protein
MKKLYLDIDGTLIRRGGVPAQGLTEFLCFATENFDCYWLTTHCYGDAAPVARYLASRIPSEALVYIESFKPTQWELWKTEAIDFSGPFVWIDDNLFEMERRALVEHTALENFIHINLLSNPAQLLDVMKRLP